LGGGGEDVAKENGCVWGAVKVGGYEVFIWLCHGLNSNGTVSYRVDGCLQVLRQPSDRDVRCSDEAEMC
jgi:hypothetical protein